MTEMMNGYKNGTWKQALKTLVASVSAVLIANLTVSSSPSFSLQWWKMVATQTLAVTLVNEARYWKNWAEKK